MKLHLWEQIEQRLHRERPARPVAGESPGQGPDTKNERRFRAWLAGLGNLAHGHRPGKDDDRSRPH